MLILQNPLLPPLGAEVSVAKATEGDQAWRAFGEISWQ